MANVLEQIVANKHEELKIKKKLLPLSKFISTLTQSTNSFYDALSAPGTSYIFECKKASPSKGLIRENFDLDEITNAYQKEAACFSVLTDEKYFQGKAEYLQYVSQKVTQPTLNKDFFVDEYQIYLARHLGANAVLLMLSVLSDEQYSRLAALAQQYAMDILTEVSNEEETERALQLGANIIGINNRNLRDLSTDLSTTERLAPKIKQDPLFKGVIISESGIYTNQDVQRLSSLVDAFLVGSALMAKPNLSLAVSELVYGKIKVCGVTSIEQANLIASYPVSYLGFIFAPNSKRYVSIETALEITHKLTHQFVGVFVNQPIQQVAEYAHKLSLSAVQLHGQESENYTKELKPLLPIGCEMWKALPVDIDNVGSIETEIAELQEHIEAGVLSRILVDCKVGVLTGGTGKTFDWRLLDNIKDKSTLVLAGGVSSQNIQVASHIGVGIIDVNSGVEDAPGNKTATQLDVLFALLRA
jgi:indole-3-glycerol phosphate synthase/phosphoribosylanthranilate isomerase